MPYDCPFKIMNVGTIIPFLQWELAFNCDSNLLKTGPLMCLIIVTVLIYRKLALNARTCSDNTYLEVQCGLSSTTLEKEVYNYNI